MATTETTIRYRVKPDVVARSIANEMILLDLESGVYFTLNQVGATIWRGLENRDSTETIVAAIVDQYEVDEETAAADLAEYAEALLNEGLLLG